jgi:transposase InsO family protein
MSGFSLQNCRISNSSDKSKLIKRIHDAAKAIPLGRVLNVIGLSSSRFYAWKSIEACELADNSSCPKSFPTQMSVAEVDTMRSLITSADYRHLSTGALARVARKGGKVFAAPATWYRLVNRHNWRHPRLRIHPPKPKVGIRASKPNEIWHVDTSLLRLLDGSRVYMHAVIDNFSRRILAWTVRESFDTGVTDVLLREAANGLTDTKPNAIMDSGIENINASVNELVESGIIKRVLAQVDVTYSNSMIESWWRSIKHRWLFLHSLDTVETVRKLVAFYVAQHNTHVPHYAARKVCASSLSPGRKRYGA